MKNSKNILWAVPLFSILFFTACEKDDPDVPNEEELITTLIYTLTPDGGGNAVEFRENASFPDGSLIVKELTSGSSVERYAILYKRSDSEHADDRGWVWGYVNEDGTVATTAEEKGAICTGCHLQPDNIDYMLMNKFFP